MVHASETAEVLAARGAGVRAVTAGRPRRSWRVLMVAPTSFFADYGCHVRILEEARVLRSLGQRVTIATYYTGRDVDGLDIRRTLPIPWRREYEVGSSRHKIAFDMLLAMRVLATGWRARPDIVHGHLHEGALIGGVAARVLGCPMVFDFQGSMSSEMVDHGFLRRESRWFSLTRAGERRINRLAHAIVTSTNHGARLLQEEFGIEEALLHPLPDHVNVEEFRPGVLTREDRERERSRLGIPADRTVVVYLGLLAAYQGIDHLLEAARRVVASNSSVHFLVMGFPGPHVYQAKAESLGLRENATFTGRVPYDQAPARLALGDIGAGPKLSDTEGSGKLLNYMAMGLPVVAFDTPVSREYLADAGAYAPRGDANALADRILELAADPAAARRRGMELRGRAETEFGWARAGERLLRLYGGLLGEAARQPAR